MKIAVNPRSPPSPGVPRRQVRRATIVALFTGPRPGAGPGSEHRRPREERSSSELRLPGRRSSPAVRLPRAFGRFAEDGTEHLHLAVRVPQAPLRAPVHGQADDGFLADWKRAFGDRTWPGLGPGESGATPPADRRPPKAGRDRGPEGVPSGALRPPRPGRRIVTGGARGLGREHAFALARPAPTWRICDLLEPEASGPRGEIESRGVRALFGRVDVTVPAEIDRFVARAEEALGPIRIS